jgi:hypothetical protein
MKKKVQLTNEVQRTHIRKLGFACSINAGNDLKQTKSDHCVLKGYWKRPRPAEDIFGQERTTHSQRNHVYVVLYNMKQAAIRVPRKAQEIKKIWEYSEELGQFLLDAPKNPCVSALCLQPAPCSCCVNDWSDGYQSDRVPC